MNRVVAILLLASGLLSHAETLQQGIGTFREAYRSWDGAKFWNAAESFKKAAAAQPQSSATHAWLGCAHFHRLLQLESRPETPRLRAAARGEREAAIRALERAVELDQAHAEAHAMLGTLYGMKIDGVMDGMRYGRRVQKHQKLALEHGAKNPRVQYLLGVALLHTAKKEPDQLEALKTLLLAAALFEAEARESRPATAPTWGHDACLAFIGEAFSDLHNPAKARLYYRKALAARPSNQMAKAGLAKLNQ